MILQKPLELLVNCRRDFSLVLYCEEMIDNLTIMFALPRQAKRRVLLLCNFGAGHHWTFWAGSRG